MPTATVACPKCGRQLAAGGVLSIGGVEAPVYQCDECLVTTQVFGEPTEVALMFCIDKNGRAIDPADPDTPLSFHG
jgi:ribosomal protein S27E